MVSENGSVSSAATKSDSRSDSRPDSRFEFRVFGQSFDEAAFRMSRLSAPVPEKLWRRESDEIYVVSRLDVSNNVKIRDDFLDIKNLSEQLEGLERWEPLAKHSFPLAGTVLGDEVFPCLNVPFPSARDLEYSREEFLDMIAGNVNVQAVRINKVRQAYMVNDTLCEVATVLINGARLTSLCIESVEVEKMLDTIRDIGLGEHDNTSYPNAIKRVIGFTQDTLQYHQGDS